jgi:hypothetical protein
MPDQYEVIVAAGSLRSDESGAVRFEHAWSPDGVSVEADFTGAHLLHVAAAGSILNDMYREAATLGIELDGVRIIVTGGFDAVTWASTGIGYSVELDSGAPTSDLTELVGTVDEVAEIPRTLRIGTTVRRVI